MGSLFYNHITENDLNKEIIKKFASFSEKIPISRFT